MKRSIIEHTRPPGFKGGPHPHERFQKDGVKGTKTCEAHVPPPHGPIVALMDNGDNDDERICQCSCHNRAPSRQCDPPCCSISPCGLRIKAGQMVGHITGCEKCRTIGE